MDDETGPTTIGALSGKIQRADAAMKRSADLIAQEANGTCRVGMWRRHIDVQSNHILVCTTQLAAKSSQADANERAKF